MSALERLGWSWAAFGFLRELIFIYPVYAIMMGENGIGPFELSLLFVLWSAIVVVLEVPSGTLGDLYSRRALLITSGVIKAGCYPAWLLLPSFEGYLLGFFLWGVASSIRSGTAESFLHDSLAEKRAVEQFERLYGRGRAAERLGVAVAFLVGGVLAESGYAWPLIVSMVGPLLASLVMAVAFVEPSRSVDAPSSDSGAADGEAKLSVGPKAGYFSMMFEGLAEVRRNPRLQSIFLLMATALTVSGVLDEYVGPALDDKGTMSLSLIGAVLSGIALTASVASVLAHRIPIRSGSAVSWLLFFASLVLALVALLPGWVAALLLLGYFALCSAAEVILDGQLQRAITGRARATIASACGFGQECCGIVFYLVIGIVAGLEGWSAGLLALAGVQGLCSLSLVVRERGLNKGLPSEGGSAGSTR